MSSSVKCIHKYVALDGTEHDTEESALKANYVKARVDEIMMPLGDRNKSDKGWVQHNLETVNRVKDAFLELCREQEWDRYYPVFKNRGRDCHPFCAIGRILSDSGGMMYSAWSRFMCIDANGREHNQPYFAYTAGPDRRHVCIENRSEIQPQ